MVSKVFGFWVTGESGKEILSKRQEIAVAIAKAGGGMQIASEHSEYAKGGSPLVGKWMRVVVPPTGNKGNLTELLSTHGIDKVLEAPNPSEIAPLIY